MGLIRRFSDLRKARAQAARTAGRLEDPAAAFDLAHERQVRALQQVRASAAQAFSPSQVSGTFTAMFLATLVRIAASFIMPS